MAARRACWQQRHRHRRRIADRDAGDGESTHGTLTLNANGSFTYTPDADYNFGPDSFTYKAGDGAADGNVATVAINGQRGERSRRWRPERPLLARTRTRRSP